MAVTGDIKTKSVTLDGFKMKTDTTTSTLNITKDGNVVMGVTENGPTMTNAQMTSATVDTLTVGNFTLAQNSDGNLVIA